MTRNILSGIAKLAVTALLAAQLGGCSGDIKNWPKSIETHHESYAWKKASQTPERVAYVTRGAYNNDLYRVCYQDRAGHTVCDCKTGYTNPDGSPHRINCNLLEKSKEEQSPWHVIKHRKYNPR